MPEGNCNNGVLIVGEALGQNEKYDGLPLRPYAEAGSVLQTVFRRLTDEGVKNCDRLDFALWNLIACQPPANKLENMPFEHDAIMHCRIHFQEVLRKYYGKIRCVLALGNLPLRYLCPEVDNLVREARLAKNKKQLKKLGSLSLRGYRFNSILGIPIVSTIHPSFIARGGRVHLHVLKRDVYFALEVAKGNIPELKTNYILEPTIEEAEEFYEECKRNPSIGISYDIETPDTILETDETEIEYENIEVRDINSIQFSIRPNEGIFFPWNEEYSRIAERILLLPNPKLGWNNWKFDETNLEYHLGKGCIKGENHDLMWCLHSATKIKLASGKFKSIGEIVNNKLDVEVLTLSKNGNVEPTKIVQWHKNVKQGQKWIRVYNSLTRYPMYLTPEHKVVTTEGKIEARNLQIGMKIFLGEGGADDVIHGCLLGDSWFNKKTNNITFIHGEPQESYADCKFNYFGIKKYDNIDINCHIRVHSYLKGSKKWHKLFYTKDGKRFVPPPSNRALAIWYMDDGNLNDATSNRKNPYYVIRIPLMGFCNQTEAFDWFVKEFGPTNVSKYKTLNNTGYMVVLSGIALHGFMQRIAEYIPSCMSYKLTNEYLGKYNGWFERREPQIVTINGIDKEKRLVPSGDDNGRYCLTVENESHTFFTMGGLVANCWKHANPDFIKTGRALQFATNFFAPEFPAWKHKSDTNPKEYGVYDVDAVVRINNGLTTALKSKRLSPESKSLYEGYIDDIVKMRPIFKHLFEIGLPIDIEAREEMRKMLVSEMKLANAKLQELYPFELRKVTPQLGYKFVPKEIDELTEEFNNIRHAGNGNNYVIFGSDEVYQLYLQKFIEQKTRIRTSKKRDGTIIEKQEETTGLLLKEFDIDGVRTKRWCRLEKFKPSSTQQVLNYIKLKGYKVPTTKNYREGDKETTTKDKISELFEETGDPLFEKVVYMRELRKMKSTYVASSKKGWVLGSDNRVHAEFKPLPATGQLSSKIHNAPARGTRFSSKGYVKLANQFRKTICAGEGKLLLSGDWSAFHALTLGFEAEDATYMRLVRLDPHSFVAAYILAQELPDKYAKIRWKKPDRMEANEWKTKVTLYEEALFKLNDLNNWINYPDDQLRDQLKWIKKNFEFTRNSQAKPAILGMGFGMKEHKFYKLNRYSFKSVKECENLLNIIRGLFPKVFVDYHKNTLAEADRLGYLLTRYGYIRWFNDVFDWRLLTKGDPRALKLGERIVTKNGRRYHVKLGQDSNSAIAFRAANDAFGKKKESMRDLWYYENDGIIKSFISEEIRNQYGNQNLIKSLGLINEIHDDLLFEIPEEKAKDAALILYEAMTRPAKFLKNSVEPNGLTTSVEIKIGKNWAPFHEIENLDGMKEFKI